jgi:hypothetical protein
MTTQRDALLAADLRSWLCASVDMTMVRCIVSVQGPEKGDKG